MKFHRRRREDDAHQRPHGADPSHGRRGVACPALDPQAAGEGTTGDVVCHYGGCPLFSPDAHRPAAAAALPQSHKHLYLRPCRVIVLVFVPPPQVRLSLGLCPQHNVLWPELTALETALFWARLKGAPRPSELAAARAALEAVGLAEAERRLAADLSGGMKRRLCLAAALASDPAVVFLDEPSAGLDPYTRRQMWEVLDRARAGRLLVLTTHAMDEAELLSTRIAIIARGRLQCVGPQSYLRRRFGGGYTLTVGYLPGREAQADMAVRAALPEAARLPGHFHGALSFHLPGDCSVAEVFSKMERLVRVPSAAPPAGSAAAAAAEGAAPAEAPASAEDEDDFFAGRSPAPPPRAAGTTGVAAAAAPSERVIAEWGLSRVGLDEVFRRIVAATEHHPRSGSLRRGGDDEDEQSDGGASSSDEEEED